MKRYMVIVKVADEGKAVKEGALADDHPECAENVEKAIAHAISASDFFEMEAEKVEIVKEGYFEITSIHRDDLKHGVTFNFSEEEIAKLTDEDMSNIASEMAEAYCDGQFWNDLQYYTREVLDEKE